jgi:hypothetical protein
VVRLGPTKIKVSSANKRYEILTSPDPTKMPKRRPHQQLQKSFYLRPTITKKEGNKGPLYLKPQKLPTRLDGESFTKTEKCTEESSPNPILLSRHSLAMSTESRICLSLTKSVMGLRNNLLDDPIQPIGKDLSNNLVNSTHNTNRAKVLKINGPCFP